MNGERCIKFLIYTDAETAKAMIDIAFEFNIEAKVIGKVESSNSKKLTIESEYGLFEF